MKNRSDFVLISRVYMYFVLEELFKVTQRTEVYSNR